MPAEPVFTRDSGTMSDFLIMYRYIRKSVKNDRFLHRLNYFDNLESLGIIEFPSMTKYPLMRRKYLIPDSGIWFKLILHKI